MGAVTPRPGRSPWPLLAAADERLRKTPTLSRASASGSLGPTFLSVNPGPGGPQTTLGLCLSPQIPGGRRGQGPAQGPAGERRTRPRGRGAGGPCGLEVWEGLGRGGPGRARAGVGGARPPGKTRGSGPAFCAPWGPPLRDPAPPAPGWPPAPRGPRLPLPPVARAHRAP